MPAGDYANSRYSDLDEINASNVGRLKAAWTFSTGVLRGHEGQPLVIDNTMYLVTPYPNVAYAIDLTQPGFPLKWKFRPENDERAAGKACCDVVNRGASFANGMLVYNLLDGHTVAVDAATGEQRWRTKVVDVATGETITMAPIIVKDMVIVGSSGGEMGVRGFLAALDLATGAERWRAYNIGPDADVKITPRFAPFYAQDKGTDLGASSWPGDAWKSRRGGVVGLGVVRSRSSISSTTAPAIPGRGTRTSDRATTSGPARSSRATPTPASCAGCTSSPRTTCGTTTG